MPEKNKKLWENKKVRCAIIAISVVLVLVSAVVLFAGNYLVTYALYVDDEKHIGSMGSDVYDGIQDTAAQKAYDEWVSDVAVSDWMVTSNDDLKLAAKFYEDPKDTHKYVLAVHGYTVDHRDIMPAA